MTYRIVPWDANSLPAPLDAGVLHGYACSAEDWVPVAELLTGHSSLLVDFPAHGLLATAPAIGFDELARGVGRLLARLPAPVVLAGHSMGGMVAMAVAVQNPGLLRGLILADAYPYLPAVVDVFGGPEDPADPFGYGSVIDRRTDPEVQQRVRTSMASGAARVGPALHAQLVGLDLRPSLTQIDIPSLAFIGDRYRTPPQSPDRLTRELGLSGLRHSQVVLVRSHHFVMLEQPGEIARYIDGFLRRLEN
jgi:pimeloyl-ACP methyl ester carboxylesterase